MTDTARSVSDMKALAADSGNHARDLIESITNPVAGGGFPGIGGPIEQTCFMSFRISANGTDQLAGVFNTFDHGSATPLPTAVPAGTTFTAWDLTVQAGDRSDSGIWDPQGWIESSPFGPEAYWGITHPANTTLHLPAGIYHYAVRTDLVAGTAGPSAAILPNFDYAEPFWLIDTFSSFYPLDQGLNKVFASTVADTRYYVEGTVAVSKAAHFMPNCLVQNTANPLHLAAQQTWVFRLR